MTTRKGATTEEQDLNTQETADDTAEEEYVPALVLGAPLTARLSCAKWIKMSIMHRSRRGRWPIDAVW